MCVVATHIMDLRRNSMSLSNCETSDATEVRVTACCSVLQRVAAWCNVNQETSDSTAVRVAACCSVLQRVAACCNVNQETSDSDSGTTTCDPRDECCITVCCSVLQRVASCCSRVAVCCSQ